MTRIVLWVSLAVISIVGCSSPAAPTLAPSAAAPIAMPAGSPSVAPGEPLVAGDGPLRLVTLGDGYTSGYPLPPQESWPAQLVSALAPGIEITLENNLAARGQTSADVIEDQLTALSGIGPHIVTIQVGANDVISPDIDLEEYRANVATILDALLAEVPARRIFAVTTPDFTLTPRGLDFGPREPQRAEIMEANAILREEAQARGIALVDISPVSDRVSRDRTLVHPDGLYPSAKQYAGWVELIALQIRDALEDGDSAG